MAIFGMGEFNGLGSLLTLLGVFVAIYIFIKFCSWSKGFEISGQIKKIIFILTGVGTVGFNVLYAMGNKTALQGDWSMATIALAVTMAWVFVFAFALMAETKSAE
ncbi:MAG TPA: hypothetical protein VFC73_07155 [Syntrophomonadaceae bacterium]|nr:hypothetical protein [Syntrophomonadaceae bacterium]